MAYCTDAEDNHEVFYRLNKAGKLLQWRQNDIFLILLRTNLTDLRLFWRPNFDYGKRILFCSGAFLWPYQRCNEPAVEIMTIVFTPVSVLCRSTAVRIDLKSGFRSSLCFLIIASSIEFFPLSYALKQLCWPTSRTRISGLLTELSACHVPVSPNSHVS